ncbi:MAG: hypothetical protein IT167_15820 [Bryobacterales bacterium]|nr:hypothetical protein [Bryobacterales bacterium]
MLQSGFSIQEVDMERGGFLSFFNNPREAAEARMRSLAATATVRKARAKAEVDFRSREVAANWRDWRKHLGELAEFDPIRLENHIPPHWQAGVRYAEMIIPAYGTTALAEIPLPNEFEKFLRECVWIVSERTYDAKLRPYESLLLRKGDVAVACFHQLVRAAVAAESARLGLEAWRRHNERLEQELASPADEITHPLNGSGGGHVIPAESAPLDPEVLSEHREKRLQEFVASNETTIAAVSDAAGVHKPDMQRWRRGELSDDSVMSQRIENVLSGKTPLKTSTAKPAA